MYCHRRRVRNMKMSEMQAHVDDTRWCSPNCAYSRSREVWTPRPNCSGQFSARLPTSRLPLMTLFLLLLHHTQTSFCAPDFSPALALHRVVYWSTLKQSIAFETDSPTSLSFSPSLAVAAKATTHPRSHSNTYFPYCITNVQPQTPDLISLISFPAFAVVRSYCSISSQSWRV